ncbi:hypothetical protein P3S68_002920 [Capsicum galapagoense]
MEKNCSRGFSAKTKRIRLKNGASVVDNLTAQFSNDVIQMVKRKNMIGCGGGGLYKQRDNHANLQYPGKGESSLKMHPLSILWEHHLLDNQATIAISHNPIFHEKSKHLNFKFFFLREVQKDGDVILVYCKTEEQWVDIFTKPLPVNKFELLRQKIGVYVS